MDAERAQRHKARMQRKQAVVHEKIAAAQSARGLLIINTGSGKGKSTAAFGLLARALGHGQRAVVVQFIKSRRDTGEERLLAAQPGVRWHVMGEGYTWDTQDAARDREAARAAWEIARAALQDPTVDVLILDEFTYSLKYQWLTLDEILTALQARPAMQHVVITGRAAAAELIELADTVSEMRLVKHAFQAGVAAMPGIEW